MRRKVFEGEKMNKAAIKSRGGTLKVNPLKAIVRFYNGWVRFLKVLIKI